MTRLPSEYGITAWQAETDLPVYALQDIRFSRGFLAADYTRLCRGIAALWVPVLSAAEVEFSDVRVIPALGVLADIERTFLFGVDGELSVVGLSGHTEEILARLFLETEELKAGKLLTDYLSRRLVNSVAKFFADDSISFGYLGESDSRDVEVEGQLLIKVATKLGELTIHFGLGPELLQRLDRVLRHKMLAEWGLKPQQRKQQFIVELGSFPEQMETSEPGAWFDTEIDVLAPVRLLSATGEVYFGRLGQFNGRFAVMSLKDAKEKWRGDGIRLELGRGELSEEELLFMRKEGAIFPTKTVVSSSAILVRGDEPLVSVTLAELDGRFVFRVDEEVSWA